MCWEGIIHSESIFPLSAAMHQSLATSCHGSPTDRGQDSAEKMALMPYCVSKLPPEACGVRLNRLNRRYSKERKNLKKMTHVMKDSCVFLMLFLFLFLFLHILLREADRMYFRLASLDCRPETKPVRGSARVAAGSAPLSGRLESSLA